MTFPTSHAPETVLRAANELYHLLCSLNEHGLYAHIMALASQDLQPDASDYDKAGAFLRAAQRVAFDLQVAHGHTPHRTARYLLQEAQHTGAPGLGQNSPPAIGFGSSGEALLPDVVAPILQKQYSR